MERARFLAVTAVSLIASVHARRSVAVFASVAFSASIRRGGRNHAIWNHFPYPEQRQGPLVCAAEKPRPLPLTPKLSLKPRPTARTCITTAATAGQGSPPVSRQTASRAINRISQQSVSPMSRTRPLWSWSSPVEAEAVVGLYRHNRRTYVCTYVWVG